MDKGKVKHYRHEYCSKNGTPFAHFKNISLAIKRRNPPKWAHVDHFFFREMALAVWAARYGEF